MPAKFVEKDLPEGADLLDESKGLKELARRYGVSVQAMAFRMANLNYIKL
jgi:Zn-dependent peptidase ImmA (M78 family)